MESYEIYDDLAPFNGDLFKLDAPVEFEPFGFEPNFDGQNSLLKPSQAVASKLDDCGSPCASDIGAVIGGPYDQPWLETQVDIQQILQGQQVVDSDSNFNQGFQILSSPEQHAAQSDNFTITDGGLETDMKILHIPEESNIIELQNNPEDSFNLSGTESGTYSCVDSKSSSVDIDFADFVPLIDDTIDDLELAHYMSSESILSPVSPEDIESLLSVSPAPQETSSHESPITKKESPQIITIDLSQLHPSITSELQKCLLGSASLADEQGSDDIAMSSSSSSNSLRHAPYDPPKKRGGRVQKSPEKKTRKMKQNKEAALRYRQKKKSEQEILNDECEILEKRNKDLNDNVDSLTREIQYLKGLMSDVYKAKGHKLAVKGIKKSK